MNPLSGKIDQIKTLCKSNKVRTLFAFGSVLKAGFNSESDMDFVVDIDESDPISYSNHYFNLKFTLEFLLHRKVDLLEQKSIRNSYLKAEIEQTKVLIYG